MHTGEFVKDEYVDTSTFCKEYSTVCVVVSLKVVTFQESGYNEYEAFLNITCISNLVPANGTNLENIYLVVL